LISSFSFMYALALSFLTLTVRDQTTPPPASAQKPDSLPLLEGRPDALSAPEELLGGGMYQNPLAGIAFRTPGNCKQVKSQGEEIARFVNENRKWELVATRSSSSQPLPLTGAAPGAHAAPQGKDDAARGARPAEPEKFGLIEVLAARLKQSSPGIELVRQDTVSLGEFDAGIIAARMNVGTERKLYQQAIIQANDQLYYLLTMTSPASKDASGADSEDPRKSRRVRRSSRCLRASSCWIAP
jgi:hypothetical protein